MTDLAEYERVGDLVSSFELTAKHARAQSERERLREVRCLRKVAAAARI